MFPRSLKQGSCSLVPYDIFPLFPCSPKPLGDPQKGKGLFKKTGKKGTIDVESFSAKGNEVEQSPSHSENIIGMLSTQLGKAAISLNQPVVEPGTIHSKGTIGMSNTQSAQANLHETGFDVKQSTSAIAINVPALINNTPSTRTESEIISTHVTNAPTISTNLPNQNQTCNFKMEKPKMPKFSGEIRNICKL